MRYKRFLATTLRKVRPLNWALALAVRIIAPRHYVGAVGAIFNDRGQILLVEHVFRPYYRWGLPGGWVERGENPADTLSREVDEELKLAIQVRKLLFCEVRQSEVPCCAPLGLELAFYCRLVGSGTSLQAIDEAPSAFEILGAQWLDPEQLGHELLPLQQKAVRLGQQEFEREAT